VAVLLREVFIASNFSEFSGLRNELARRIDGSGFARAVDLNRNEADACSPLRRSVGRIRSSDLVVLLVGTQYGRDKPDGKCSYTHLEYLEARSEGLQILPYFFGPGYSKAEGRPQRGDPKLNPLQREVLAYRADLTVAFHDEDADPGQLADAILDRVREALLGVREGAALEDEELEFTEQSALGTNDLESLERRSRSSNPPATELELLRRPAEAAAAEQLREARRALQAFDRSTAIFHLRKALELRPLDLDAGYDLGRLLLTSTRHKHLREASKLAQRVARVAALEENEIRQGFALALSANAEARLGNEQRALDIAAEALSVADRIATVHMECASVYARLSRMPQAVQRARRAFVLRPVSFIRSSHDPVLAQSAEFRALQSELLAETRATATNILRIELESIEFATAVGVSSSTASAESSLSLLPTLDLFKAVAAGKEGAERTQRTLRAGAQRLPDKERALAEFRAELSRLDAERTRILAQPVGSLRPPIADRLCLGVPVAAALVHSLVSGREWTSALLLVASSFAVGLALRTLLRRRQLARRIQAELAILESKLAAARSAETRSKEELSQLSARFVQLVTNFEQRAVAPPGGTFSPSVGTAGAAPGKLVRIRPHTPPPGFELELELFPPDSGLRETASRGPSSIHQLFKVLRRRDGQWFAARWACYFDEPRNR